MFKIGIVGAGIIGKSHSDAIYDNPDCTLVAVCDTVEERARAIALQHNSKTYTDYKKMAEETELDAVILNLPHFLHKDISIYFLERKIAVLVEKPMAIDVEECNEMIESAERNNTPLAVGHVQRYFSCYEKVKEIIKTNKLGKLCQMIEIRNINYFTEERPSWFLSKKLSGGGIIMNYGAHTLDKFSYVTGLKIEKVSAGGNNFITENDVEATAQMLVTYEGGVTAMCSYCGTQTNGQHEIYFYFTNGAVKIEEGGHLMSVCEGVNEYELIELESADIFSDQLKEFVKLLKNEESNVATAQFSREIVRTLSEAISQIL